MKKTIVFIGLLFASSLALFAQSLDDKYLDKVKTIDGTIETLYGVISGAKGQVRNWELMQYLYYPQAQLVATGKNKEGKIGALYLSPDNYVENSGPWLIENGFFEKEIHREVDQFGYIAQVFSTYHCFKSEADTEPFMRGINSIQLLYNGKRWWVMNIFLGQETEEHPIPEMYLPKG